MKTSELNVPALDWAVAKAQGVRVGMFAGTLRSHACGCVNVFGPEYSPSTDWSLGGPIIERERITISQGRDLMASIWTDAYGENGGYKFKQTGPTPLIAAMRCLVTARLGDEVEIPEELAK